MILDFVNCHIDISPDREAFMLLIVSFDFSIFYLLSQVSRDIISKWWQVASHLCLLEEQWRGVARLQRWNPDKERYRLQERIHYQGGEDRWPLGRSKMQWDLGLIPIRPSLEPCQTSICGALFYRLKRSKICPNRASKIGEETVTYISGLISSTE